MFFKKKQIENIDQPEFKIDVNVCKNKIYYVLYRYDYPQFRNTRNKDYQYFRTFDTLEEAETYMRDFKDYPRYYQNGERVK